ncbi:MAG: phage tail protein [Bacteroidetes bacterium]|nr:phage tail protein [Bacteroidota bacterium]
MPNNDRQNETVWPISKFYFEVDLSPTMTGIAFQEVSGLDLESQVIEYRQSNSPTFSTAKMPGIKKYGNVTMKRGIFKKENSFWEWYKEINANTIKRHTVSIKLLDESGNVTMQWNLANAWPTKISGTDLKADGNEVAIETLELAHEGLTVINE